MSETMPFADSPLKLRSVVDALWQSKGNPEAVEAVLAPLSDEERALVLESLERHVQALRGEVALMELEAGSGGGGGEA